ncbi:TAXI family TRAP transporter solute-binding subunit [Thermodesulfobacteriota bacterium]
MNKIKIFNCATLLTMIIILAIGISVVEAENTLPKEIAMVSQPPGGPLYTVSAAVASIVETTTGIKVYVESPGGGLAIMQRVRAGAHMFAQNTLAASKAWLGEGPFKKIGRIPVRLLGSTKDTWVAVVVRSRSGINSFEGLKGHAWYAHQAGSSSAMALIDGIHGYLGTTKDDYPGWRLYTSSADISNPMIEGRVDAATMFLGSAFQQIQNSIDIKILPIPDKMAAYFAKHVRGWYTKTMPAGKYGYPEAVRTFNVASGIEVRADISDELAYTLTKAIWDDPKRIKAAGLKTEQFNLERATIVPPLPFHSGAIRYYKEKGLWTSELEENQKELLRMGN